MSHPKLKWAMARFALKLAESHELIDAAHAALDDGFYSYSLGELATQYEPTDERSKKLFIAALGELGLKLPDLAASVEMMLEADAIEGILIWPPYAIGSTTITRSKNIEITVFTTRCV